MAWLRSLLALAVSCSRLATASPKATSTAARAASAVWDGFNTAETVGIAIGGTVLRFYAIIFCQLSRRKPSGIGRISTKSFSESDETIQSVRCQSHKKFSILPPNSFHSQSHKGPCALPLVKGSLDSWPNPETLANSLNLSICRRGWYTSA